jgi:hypothetical protein
VDLNIIDNLKVLGATFSSFSLSFFKNEQACQESPRDNLIFEQL